MFEGHACAHMDVWNEVEPTDGPGELCLVNGVTGQWAQILSGPGTVFCCLLGSSRDDQERGGETDGVCVEIEDLKVGARREERNDDRNHDRASSGVWAPVA